MCVWALHGLFASGVDFDSTFGLVHTVEKASDIHYRARMLSGHSGAFMNTIPDEGLRTMAKTYALPVREDFLD